VKKSGQAFPGWVSLLFFFLGMNRKDQHPRERIASQMRSRIESLQEMPRSKWQGGICERCGGGRSIRA
jgi:hypothetical protein